MISHFPPPHHSRSLSPEISTGSHCKSTNSTPTPDFFSFSSLRTGYCLASSKQSVHVRPSPYIKAPFFSSLGSLPNPEINASKHHQRIRNAQLLARTARICHAAEEMEAMIQAEEYALLELPMPEDKPDIGLRAVTLAKAARNSLVATQQIAKHRLQEAQITVTMHQETFEEIQGWVSKANCQIDEVLHQLSELGVPLETAKQLHPPLPLSKTNFHDLKLKRLDQKYWDYFPSITLADLMGESNDTDSDDSEVSGEMEDSNDTNSSGLENTEEVVASATVDGGVHT